MNIDKAISIKCGGEIYCDHNELHHFQGDLKSITKEKFQELKQSLIDNGLPLALHIWIDKNKKWTLDGHHRVLAFKALSEEGYFIPPIPCIVVKAKSKKEAAKIVLIANSRHARMSDESLNDFMIGNELSLPDLENLDLIDLDMNNFAIEDDSELNQVNGDGDYIPEKILTKAKFGDIFELGDHRVICADSTDPESIKKLMNGDEADMIFSDPPYGVSYEKKCEGIANQSKNRRTSEVHNDDISVDELKDVLLKVFKNYDSVLADKSNYYICSPQGGELGLMMMMMQESNLICRHMIIWVKNAPVFSMGRLDYDYRHEPILYGWSENRTHHKLQKGEFQNSVWEVDREPNKLHPTMKPIKLPINAILNSCPENGIVIDFFGGSGSTLIAAEATGRRARLSEYSSHYVDVIVQRWQEYSGKLAYKLNDDGTKTLYNDIKSE